MFSLHNYTGHLTPLNHYWSILHFTLLSTLNLQMSLFKDMLLLERYKWSGKLMAVQEKAPYYIFYNFMQTELNILRVIHCSF